MKTTIALPLLLAACTSSSIGGPIESQQDQASTPGTYNEVFRGSEATVTYADLATRISIDVFESASNQYPGDTFLFYSFSVADPSSQVCDGSFCFYKRFVTDLGFGHLPATDAQITPGSAEVHTSTDVAGFTTMQCTFDERDYSNICTDGVAGSINLAWQRTGYSTLFQNGFWRQTTPSYMQQSSGTYWTVSAQTRGSLPNGHSFEVPSGTLNDSKGTTISKSFAFGPQQP